MQFALLVLVGGISVGLFWWSSVLPSGSWKSFFQAVATGLLVSAAFGVAQALVTGRVSTELLRESVVTEVNQSLSESNQAFFPTHDFPSSVTPNPTFNAQLMADLDESSIFWFRGLSARYTAARLVDTRSVNLQFRAIIPDLTVPHSLDNRVNYLLHHRLCEDAVSGQVYDRVKHDIWTGLVALFHARHACASMDVTLTPSQVLDRFELFRSSVWVTLFTDVTQGTLFPRTLRFSSASIFYRMQEADMLNLQQSPACRSFRITQRMKRSEFAQLFKDMTGQVLTDELFNELTDEFESFRKKFRETARIGGR
jgi:hypothetical protein